MSIIKSGTTSTTAYQVEANTNGDLVIQTGTSSNVAMTVNSSGNVGINVSQPSTTFNVGHESHGVGIAYINSSTLSTVAGAYTTASGWGYGFGDLILKTRTDFGGFYSIIFATASSNNTPVERARITSGGVLLVGTTSVPTNGASAAGSATFNEPINFKGFRSHAGTTGAFAANDFNVQWNGSAARLWVDTTDLGSISVSSDYRVKKNVQTQIESGVNRVMQLRPVTYEFADYGELYKADGVVREGFIAHEVQEVIPSGAEGQKDEENRIQNLRVDAILSVAIKAIQEQQAMIDDLKAEVAALKAKE